MPHAEPCSITNTTLIPHSAQRERVCVCVCVCVNLDVKCKQLQLLQAPLCCSSLFIHVQMQPWRTRMLASCVSGLHTQEAESCTHCLSNEHTFSIMLSCRHDGGVAGGQE